MSQGFVVSVVAALLRHALTAVSGYFLAKGVLTPDQIDTIILSVAGLLVASALATLSKHRQKVREIVALELPEGSTPAALQIALAKRAAGNKPDVMPLVLAFLLVTAPLFATSCGGSSAANAIRRAQVGSTAVFVALESLPSLVQSLVATGKLTHDEAAQVNERMNSLAALYAAFDAELQRAEKLNDGVRVALVNLIEPAIAEAQRLNSSGLLFVKNPLANAQLQAVLLIVQRIGARVVPLLKAKPTAPLGALRYKRESDRLGRDIARLEVLCSAPLAHPAAAATALAVAE